MRDPDLVQVGQRPPSSGVGAQRAHFFLRNRGKLSQRVISGIFLCLWIDAWLEIAASGSGSARFRHGVRAYSHEQCCWYRRSTASATGSCAPRSLHARRQHRLRPPNFSYAIAEKFSFAQQSQLFSSCSWSCSDLSSSVRKEPWRTAPVTDRRIAAMPHPSWKQPLKHYT